MDWFEPRDNYCERLDASLMAEPLNAVTNLLFIYFALVIFWENEKSSANKSIKYELRWLSSLLLLIGLGSLSFHTFANRLTEMFDILGIIFFIIAYLFFLFRRAFKFSTAKRIGIITALLIFTIVFAAVVPDEIFNGSHIYFPVFGLFIWIVARLKKINPGYYKNAKIALIVIFISIVFRTLDSLVCSAIPIGTHFLWHTLNASAFYLLLKNYRALH